MWLSEHLYEYHKIERANEWVKLLQTRENEIYDMERDEQ